MDSRPWKILETKDLYSGIRLDHCQRSDGSNVEMWRLDYDDEILVVALTKKQEVVLVRQYRHGVQKVIWELPGGSVDEGESPLKAAKRELMEETGFTSDTFIEVGHGSPIPAIFTNTLYYFLALEVEQRGEQSAWDSENIEISLIPLDEVVAMAKQGNLPSALNTSALFYILAYLKRVS